MNKLNVLYEDNHLIVVVKGTNVLSQSDITGDDDMLTIIKSYIKEKYHKPGNVYLGLVHRLDRVVGGVMVFARTSKAASRLSESIRNNSFHKEYLAICHGKLKESDTFIDLSLVKVNLKTGRHHQIRVQFASRNYPLVGDNRYGNDSEKEIGLFAYKLSFPHPITKEMISFTYIPYDKPFNLFNISL